MPKLEPKKIAVQFNKLRILPNGAVGSVTIEQEGQEITLVPQQAVSLAKQIIDRYGNYPS